MSAAAISLGLVSVLTYVSYRHARSTRESWHIAAAFLTRDGRIAPREASPLPARVWIAELNEVTIELDGKLRQAGGVARACAKAALATGALGGVLDATALLHGDSVTWLGALLCFVGGCVGALVCAALGRMAEGESARLRSAWDALIRQSARDVAT